MEDHRGFNGKITVLTDQKFVIRLTVFSGEDHRSGIHRVNGILYVPVVCGFTGETNRIEESMASNSAIGEVAAM